VLLFEAPTPRLEKYGVFQKDCQLVVNAIAQTQVATVLFAGCSDDVTSWIRPQLIAGGVKCFNADELSDSPLEDPIHDMVQDSRASGGEQFVNVVAIEEGHSLSFVIARNLAAATGSVLVTIPHVTVDKLNWCNRLWRDWTTKRDIEMDDSRDQLRDFLGTQLSELEPIKPATITYITVGVPYGIIDFGCPTTHLFMLPLLGVTIANGLLKTLKVEMRCPVVVIVDPSTTEHSERMAIHDAFRKHEYLIRQAVGTTATALAARYLTEFLPSDAVFLSTHCGEVSGQLVTEEIATSDGKKHCFVYERVISGFRSPNPELFEINTLFRPVSLDSKPWSDDASKDAAVAQEIMEMIVSERSDQKTMSRRRFVSVVSCGVVQYSDSLQMSDLLYHPDPIVVGGMLHPIIFNNACASSRELAPKFIAAGASAYIGTTREIADSLSAEVARRFAVLVAGGTSIAAALHQAQRPFAQDLHYSPYLAFGYAFTHLSPPPKVPMDGLVEIRLTDAMLSHRNAKSKSSSHEHQIDGTLRFLLAEIQGLRKQRDILRPNEG
jgi:hypothetical protein